MNNNLEHGKLRSTYVYLISSLKFYNLKSQKLPPVIFTVVLFFSFIPVIITKLTDVEVMLSDYSKAYQYIIIYIACTFMVYLSSSIYLIACIKEFKNEDYTFASCTALVLKRMWKIIIVSMFNEILIMLGAFLLLIPGLILYLMYIFNISYVLDQNIGIFSSFKISKKITNGLKLQLYNNSIFFILIRLFAFFAPVSISNSLSEVFVFYFIIAIVSLMQQRLVALMYVDLTQKIIEN